MITLAVVQTGNFIIKIFQVVLQDFASTRLKFGDITVHEKSTASDSFFIFKVKEFFQPRLEALKIGHKLNAI